MKKPQQNLSEKIQKIDKMTEKSVNNESKILVSSTESSDSLKKNSRFEKFSVSKLTNGIINLKSKPFEINTLPFSSLLYKLEIGKTFEAKIFNVFDSKKSSFILKCEEASKFFEDCQAILDKSNETSEDFLDSNDRAVSIYHEKVGGWSRAFIFRLEENRAHVCFVDYGDIGIVPIKKLRNLPDGLCRELPGLSLIASLHKPSTETLDDVIAENNTIVFKVDGVKADKVKVALMNENKDIVSHLIIKPWHDILPSSEKSTNIIENEVKCNDVLPYTEKKEKIVKKFDDSENCTNSTPEVTLIKKQDKPVKKLSELNNNVETTSVENVIKPDIFLNEKLTYVSFNMNEKIDAKLLWVTPENEIFVQMIASELTSAFNSLQDILSKHCSNAKAPSTVKIGELVCTYLELDDTWYRAEVLKISDDDNISVKFIDFGNEDIVSLRLIRPYSSEIADFKVNCLKCQIEGIETKNRKVYKVLASLIGEETQVKIEAIQISPLTIKLYDQDGNLLLSKFLKSSIEPTKLKTIEELDKNDKDLKEPKVLVKETRLSDMCMFDECNNVKLQNGKQDVVVLQVINPQMIFVTPVENLGLYEKVESMSEEMNKYCGGRHAIYYKPIEGEVCLAKFSKDNSWYRAVCMEVKEDSCLVFFIDYANFEEVKFSSIVMMNRDFIELPAMTVHCVIDGVTVEQNDAVKLNKLTEILKCDEIHTINVLSFDADSELYNIQIPSVQDIFKQ